MSENRELSNSEHEAQDDSATAVNPVHITHSQDPSTRNTPKTTDAESDIIYTKRLRKGKPTIDFNVASGINKELLKKEVITRPNARIASADVSLADTINIIDTYDRPGSASAEGTYAGTGTYAHGSFEDEPGKRIPKAGAFAEAGVGRARAEFSVFEAEAKGPNASARAEANVFAAGAIARAELASASAKAGPVGVKVGLGVDTGASVGADGLEVKVLGTGFKFGPETSISLLGSEVSCSVM